MSRYQTMSRFPDDDEPTEAELEQREYNDPAADHWYEEARDHDLSLLPDPKPNGAGSDSRK